MSTYRITYEEPDTKERYHLFTGDSYKRWFMQLTEYERLSSNRNLLRIAIERSVQPWISFGGLKWCDGAAFQECLDEEGQGRKVEHFKFKPYTPGRVVLRSLNDE